MDIELPFLPCQAMDPEAGKRLWRLSQTLTGARIGG
jgi:hypothetical protein